MRGLLVACCLLSAAAATIVVDTGHDKRLNHRADGKHAAVASPVLRAAGGVLRIRAPPAAVAVDTYSATLFALGDAHLSIRGALARPTEPHAIHHMTLWLCSELGQDAAHLEHLEHDEEDEKDEDEGGAEDEAGSGGGGGGGGGVLALGRRFNLMSKGAWCAPGADLLAFGYEHMVDGPGGAVPTPDRFHFPPAIDVRAGAAEKFRWAMLEVHNNAPLARDHSGYDVDVAVELQAAARAGGGSSSSGGGGGGSLRGGAAGAGGGSATTRKAAAAAALPLAVRLLAADLCTEDWLRVQGHGDACAFRPRAGGTKPPGRYAAPDLPAGVKDATIVLTHRVHGLRGRAAFLYLFHLHCHGMGRTVELRIRRKGVELLRVTRSQGGKGAKAGAPASITALGRDPAAAAGGAGGKLPPLRTLKHEQYGQSDGTTLQLKDGKALRLADGDVFTLRCVFDTSGRTEPVKLDMKATDEMCQAFLNGYAYVKGALPWIVDKNDAQFSQIVP